MKIYIAHSEDKKLGGGWSWIANMKKAIPNHLTNYNESDVYLIPSPSICTKEEVQQAKKDGKKIVLRVDNIIRNSRNRNTGMSRLKLFSELADLIIFQSNFAKDLLMPFIKTEGIVILNGIDTQIFHPNGRTEQTTARFIYSRVNRDETKNWEMARLLFQQESQKRDGDAILNIVGQFSSELIEYNFDFYMGEKYQYWGVMNDAESIANIYRNSDYLIYSFWNDACSNTLIEALCCGCIIADPYNMCQTGGAPEILNRFYSKNGEEFFSLDRMGNQYLEAINELV